MQSDSPKIGIVGLGGIGHYHADLLEDQEARLVGGVDISGDARRAFSEKFNVSTYEQVDDLLEVADALFVTTPNRFHEEYTLKALGAGLDVLLEKPLAHTLESAERIVEAAHAAEGFCMVGFNNRFSAPVEVIKQYQENGRFGELSHIEANYVRRPLAVRYPQRLRLRRDVGQRHRSTGVRCRRLGDRIHPNREGTDDLAGYCVGNQPTDQRSVHAPRN